MCQSWETSCLRDRPCDQGEERPPSLIRTTAPLPFPSPRVTPGRWPLLQDTQRLPLTLILFHSPSPTRPASTSQTARSVEISVTLAGFSYSTSKMVVNSGRMRIVIQVWKINKYLRFKMKIKKKVKDFPSDRNECSKICSSQATAQ